MTISPSRGDAVSFERDRAPRRQPQSPSNLKISPGIVHSADRFSGQDLPSGNAGDRTQRRRSHVDRIIARIRMIMIVRLLLDANDGPCLTDDAVVYLDEYVLQADIACSRAGADLRVETFVARYTPSIKVAEAAEAVERIRQTRPPGTAGAIGDRLNLSPEVWARLQITHIWPRRWKAEDVEAARRPRKAAHRKAVRIESGETKTPRERSKTAIKPWVLGGMSRAKFYRRPADEQAALVRRAIEAVS